MNGLGRGPVNRVNRTHVGGGCAAHLDKRAQACQESQAPRPSPGRAGGFAAGFVGSGGDLQAAGIGALTGGALGFVGGSSLFGGRSAKGSRALSRPCALRPTA